MIKIFEEYRYISFGGEGTLVEVLGKLVRNYVKKNEIIL